MVILRNWDYATVSEVTTSTDFEMLDLGWGVASHYLRDYWCGSRGTWNLQYVICK